MAESEKWLDKTSPQGEPQLQNPDRKLLELQLQELLQERNALTLQLGVKSGQVSNLMRELAESQKELEKARTSAAQADSIAKMRGEELAKVHQIVADMEATVRTCVSIAGQIIGGAHEKGE
jgi:septum formation inhibitor MinC